MLRIYTVTCNRPDFIELQLRCFKKQIQEEFEFTVFNNAAFDFDKTEYNNINVICNNLNISVIDVQKEKPLLDAMPQGGPYAAPTALDNYGRYTSANVAHAYTMCWAWKHFITKETGPIAIFDSDMFLIQPLAITEMLNCHQLYFIPQGRANEQTKIEYVWPGFVLANLSTLPDINSVNWWCGKGRGELPLDVGGQTYQYLEAHPEINICHVWEECILFPPSYYSFISLEGKRIALHYCCASNWNHLGSEYHETKTRHIKEQLGI